MVKKLQNRANVISGSLESKMLISGHFRKSKCVLTIGFFRGLAFKADEVEIGKMAHWDRSSKDARLAFYQTADVKKLKYDDIAPEIVSEVDPECLEALIKLLIAMLEVRFLKLE